MKQVTAPSGSTTISAPGSHGQLVGHGAERLVAALVSRGLAPEHYQAAARLALALDRDCARRRQEEQREAA
jgi:hypothetical protein